MYLVAQARASRRYDDALTDWRSSELLRIGAGIVWSAGQIAVGGARMIRGPRIEARLVVLYHLEMGIQEEGKRQIE